MIWVVLGIILAIVLISVLIFSVSNKKAYRNHYSSDSGLADVYVGGNDCGNSSSGSDGGSCGGDGGGGGGGD